jgi:arginine exporter protein ArgO
MVEIQQLQLLDLVLVLAGVVAVVRAYHQVVALFHMAVMVGTMAMQHLSVVLARTNLELTQPTELVVGEEEEVLL